jgi:hypothetical protein
MLTLRHATFPDREGKAVGFADFAELFNIVALSTSSKQTSL